MFIGLHLTLFYFKSVAPSNQLSFLLGLDLPMPIIHVPFLYLYTAAMTNQMSSNNKINFLHFIAPIISFLMFSKFFILFTGQKIDIYSQAGAGYEMLILIKLIMIFISGIAYVSWSFVLLYKHRKNIADHFYNSEKINLNWLRYLVYGIGIVWIFVYIGEEKWIFGPVILYGVLLGFFSIRQVGIFTCQKLSHDTNIAMIIKESTIDNLSVKPIIDSDLQVIKSNKYAISGLSPENAVMIHKELQLLM